MEYTPDKELCVFAVSEERAREFFGVPPDTPVRKTGRENSWRIGGKEGLFKTFEFAVKNIFDYPIA